MEKFIKKNPVLLVVDVQKGFLDEKHWGGNRNNKNAELVCSKLIKKWRDLNLKIIHVKHSSLNPKSPLYKNNLGFEFNQLVTPLNGETIITKNVNSAFIGTKLKEKLDKEKCTTLVIVGLTTDHCISSTVRMAGNYGYETYVVSDATATFDKNGFDGKNYSSEQVHQISLASLKDEFAIILKYEELINMK